MTNFKVLIAICISQLLINRAMAQGSTDYLKDEKIIEEGKSLFQQNCSSCHSFNQRGIGPDLSGVTAEVPRGTLMQFIRNSQSLIEGGNPRATRLFAEYKVPMPGFGNFSNDQLGAILAYVNTYRIKDESATIEKFGMPVKDPIPQRIIKSGLTLELQEVTTAMPSAVKAPLARINQMKVLSGRTERNFIEDLNGKLYELKAKELIEVMDLKKLIPGFITAPGYATGFESFAFHPEFYKNGLLYTLHSENAHSGPADFPYDSTIPVRLQSILSVWKINKPKSGIVAGERKELLRLDMPSAVHSMQEIAFNPLSSPKDPEYGLLYITVGDGGSAEAGFSALCNSNTQIRASILRIDPLGNNSKNGRYGIPSINPFANDNDEKTLGEVYARGFRNPNRISWTPDGKMLVSDIGLTKIEELNFIQAGADYGWPVREGTFFLNHLGRMDQVYSLQTDEAKFNFVYPIAQFDHDEGTAISAGYPYEGNIPALKHKYIFGDISSGRVFYINYNEIVQSRQSQISEFKLSFNGQISDFKAITKNNRADLRFGLGADKQIYIFTKTDGKIWKVTGCK